MTHRNRRRKRVLITYTGGTIGMKPSADGYKPAAGFLETQLQKLPELTHHKMPDFDIHEYDPLLDSADMSSEDWVKIAQDIAAHYDDYDGFIIIHGTDTMAYTASALSFLLHNLDKTVIVTGSQIPIAELRNDAREMLISAMLIAAHYRIPEVCLYFNNKLLRGNRAVKVDALGLDAFESPNYPPLADIGIEIKVNRRRVLPMPDGEFELYSLQQAEVGAMRLFPGVSAAIVRNFLQPPIQGLVLETYGIGNGPSNNTAFLAALHEASERGVVIVNCTQCLHGAVNMSKYATGEALKQVGVISGHDMTPQAALTKLYFLLSRGMTTDEVRKFMQLDLRGELTLPPTQL
jgi:L-asparaginase